MYRKKKYLRLYISIFHRKEDELEKYGPFGEEGSAVLKKGYYYSYKQFRIVFHSTLPEGMKMEKFIVKK